MMTDNETAYLCSVHGDLQVDANFEQIVEQVRAHNE